MIILFFGKQGSGKGTQGKIISEKLKIPHISTGDLLRSAEGEIKEKIQETINKGIFVSDEIIIRLLKNRISEKDCSRGFILDGFPRTLIQAKELDNITKVDKVIEIYITDEEAKKRLGTRINCKCGRIYNLNVNPPKKEGICDNCHEKLFQRQDDVNIESIEKRLETYKKETMPVLEHYKKRVIKIDGEQDIEKVTEDILRELED